MKQNVFSLVSPRSGRAVPNQFIIEKNGCKYFQSYSTIIAKIDKNGVISLDREMWDYSKTTIKYLGVFLESQNIEISGINAIRKAIEQKDVNLTNLN